MDRRIVYVDKFLFGEEAFSLWGDKAMAKKRVKDGMFQLSNSGKLHKQKA